MIAKIKTQILNHLSCCCGGTFASRIRPAEQDFSLKPAPAHSALSLMQASFTRPSFLAASCLSLALALSCSFAAFADTYIHGFLLYTVEDQSVTIIDYTGDEETVVVPSMIGGNPVNVIASGAFSDNDKVKEVQLPDTIMSVEEGAFSSGQDVVYDENYLKWLDAQNGGSAGGASSGNGAGSSSSGSEQDAGTESASGSNGTGTSGSEAGSGQGSASDEVVSEATGNGTVSSDTASTGSSGSSGSDGTSVDTAEIGSGTASGSAAGTASGSSSSGGTGSSGIVMTDSTVVTSEGASAGAGTAGISSTAYGIRSASGSLLTTDDEGHLLLVDASGNERVLSSGTGYSRSTGTDGQTVITGPDGALLTVNADGILTFTDTDGQSVTVDLATGSMAIADESGEAAYEEVDVDEDGPAVTGGTPGSEAENAADGSAGTAEDAAGNASQAAFSGPDGAVSSSQEPAASGQSGSGDAALSDRASEDGKTETQAQKETGADVVPVLPVVCIAFLAAAAGIGIYQKRKKKES